jgi:hypothetical protein
VACRVLIQVIPGINVFYLCDWCFLILSLQSCLRGIFVTYMI